MVKKRERPYQNSINKTRAEILFLLKTIKSISKVADKQNVSYAAIYKTRKKLIKLGLLDENNNETEEGLRFLNQNLVVSNFGYISNGEKKEQIRLHDLQINAKILNKPSNWNEHRQAIVKIKNLKSKEWYPIDNAFFQEFDYEDVIVRTTENSILIKFEDIYGESPKACKEMALFKFYRVIPHIEKLFNIELDKPDYININITRQHNALIFNEIAKQFLNAGIFLKVYDNDGKLRVIVDDSEKLKELEAVSSIHAEEDAEAMQNFIRDVVLNKHYSISDISRKIQQLTIGLELTAKQLALVSTQLNSSAQLQSNTLRIMNMLTEKKNKPEIIDDTPISEDKPDYVG